MLGRLNNDYKLCEALAKSQTMLISKLRKSQSEFVQGAIFLANLKLRNIRHRINQQKVSSKVQLNPVWNVERYKKSDTLFILGSGASIASYSDKQFERIGQHDSIGFNFWLLHEFIPTFITLEFIENSDRSDSLWRNLNKRKEDYENVPIIFKYSNAFLNQCSQVPSQLKEVYLASCLSIPGKHENVLERWIKYLNAKGYFSPKNKSQNILYRQASLSWLISFALQLEYKHIVFCGVDLNSPEYFYELNSEYILKNALDIPVSGFVGDKHPTESIELSVVHTPISRVLKLSQDLILDGQAVQLWIGSKNSALYPDIPAYEW